MTNSGRFYRMVMKDRETWLMLIFVVVLYGSTYWNDNAMAHHAQIKEIGFIVK